MHASYPRFLAWRRKLDGISHPDGFFSAKTVGRIHRAFDQLAASPYRLVYDVVDDAYLDVFTPIYEAHIGSKKNGHIFTVKENVLSGMAKGSAYGAISLYESDTLIGGFIFSIHPKALSSAYRAFPHSLPIKLAITISHLAEHMFFAKAIELGKTHIRHGKDRNAYGLHSNIGLAEYKMRLGCKPYISKAPDNEILPFPVDCKGEDALFFLGSESGQRMNEAILVSDLSSDDLRVKYPVLMAQDSDIVTLRVMKHEEVRDMLSVAA